LLFLWPSDVYSIGYLASDIFLVNGVLPRAVEVLVSIDVVYPFFRMVFSLSVRGIVEPRFGFSVQDDTFLFPIEF
jgi:hypothetical protein